MKSQQIRIEKACVAQVDAISELFDLYRQFYGQRPDREKCRTYIHDRLANSESVIFLAVDANDEAAGFTQLYWTFCSVDISKILVLYDLFVLDQARGCGVGRLLMNRAKEYAREYGASRLDLQTSHSNRVAQRLYESLGYQRDLEYYSYSLAL